MSMSNVVVGLIHTKRLSLILRICAEGLKALDMLDQVTTQKRGAKVGHQQAAKAPALREELLPKYRRHRNKFLPCG